MKVGIIIRRLNMRGGVQRQVLSLARELSNQGLDIRLYTFFYDKSYFADLIGELPVVVLPPERHKKTSGSFGMIGELAMSRELAKMMERDLDVLHPHDMVSHYVSHYYKKNIKKIPSVWYMNELPFSRWPLRLLEYVENLEFHDVSNKPLWLRKLIILLRTIPERFYIGSQDVILLLSTFHFNFLKQYIGREGKIVLSGVEVEKFAFKAHRCPQAHEKISLLSSGIFLNYRRYEDLIKALSFLVKSGMNAQLVILGAYKTDMKYYSRLIELAKLLGVFERVSFYGEYTDEELQHFLEISHLFVFPHLQVQGLSVYEAISAGLPSIVTPIPGSYETLINEQHVLKAKPKDPEDLSRVIKKIIQDPILYQKISIDGSRHVHQNLTWKKYADQVLKELEGAVKKFSWR